MTRRENILKIVEQLPESRLEELEKIAISMLEAPSKGQPRAKRSFQDAKAYTFENFDECLRNLAK